MTERKIIISVFFILSVMIGLVRGSEYHITFKFLTVQEQETKPVKPRVAQVPVKVPIVIYHSVRPYIRGESAEQDTYDVTPELLEKQLEYLKVSGFTTITFEALADYFDEGKPLPVKPIILSFDDAWQNQYNYAFPLLVKHKMIATFFVFTNSLNRKNHLTWNETREMKIKGMEIGSHTKFHPFLNTMATPMALENEVMGSKKILEESVGTTTTFAYPFGQYSTSSVDETITAGYRTARAIRKGNIQSEADRYALKGFIVSDSLEEFKNTINK